MVVKVTTIVNTNLVNKSTMAVKSLHILAIEIFKTLNNQNPSFMREIFYRSLCLSHKKTNYLSKVRNGNGNVKFSVLVVLSTERISR